MRALRDVSLSTSCMCILLTQPTLAYKVAVWHIMQVYFPKLKTRWCLLYTIFILLLLYAMGDLMSRNHTDFILLTLSGKRAPMQKGKQGGDSMIS